MVDKANFKKMTDEELEAQLAEWEAAHCGWEAAQAEKNRRWTEKTVVECAAARELQETKKKQERAALLVSGKFKKLALDCKRVWERVQRAAAENCTLDVTLPVKFTLDVDLLSGPDDAIWDCLDSYVFADNGVKGSLGQCEGINRVQRALLQSGLDSVLGDACKDVHKLFADAIKEQKGATADWNKVRRAAKKMGFGSIQEVLDGAEETGARA